jgi:amidase
MPRLLAAAARGPLWGVPIVIKANTSIEGQITTDGWDGYTIPGHELIAPRDATVVAKLRAAGAVLIGHTNMPDFANSDTNRSSSFGRTGNAYDVRFSPGGSSGGTVTAVTSNMAVLGTGTDTGNSIRMPAATSAWSVESSRREDWSASRASRRSIGCSTIRDLSHGVSPMRPSRCPSWPHPIRSIHRLCSPQPTRRPGPYTQYLKPDALRGKRFGVPAFILHGVGPPFHGVPALVPDVRAEKQAADQANPLDPATRTAFIKAIDELRAAGATIVMDDAVLPDSFATIANRVATYPYVKEGTDLFLKTFGPAQYHSAAEYEAVVGQPLGQAIIGTETLNAQFGDVAIRQRNIETDPEAEANFFAPRKRLMEVYLQTMDRLHLDGYVYPAIQMPPVDETMPQDGLVSGGPHSDTSWVNMLGVPAIVVVGGFYPGGSAVRPRDLHPSVARWRPRWDTHTPTS